jgi:putative ABC transport system ATP-binding protein
VSSETVVELSDVKFTWPAAQRPVIDGFSLRLAPGERLFLRGPSGSGKSTLLNLLTGVVAPQAGTIKVLGVDLRLASGATRDRFRADHIGYVFQMFNLIPYLSVLENVCLACGFSEIRRAKAAKDSGSVAAAALKLLAALDLQGDAILRRAVTELSVGQQQRVAAARALIGAPELLIADEPTSSLDGDRREAFIELVLRQCEREGTTLVFASHDASLAPLFDRSIELAPGPT